MTVFPHPPQFSLFPRLKIKLRGRHFDTIEVFEAESHELVNTLTERDFQDAIKKWQKRWEQCIRTEGDYFEVIVASRPKIVYYMSAPVPEIKYSII
jgi:hypothetical protein